MTPARINTCRGIGVWAVRAVALVLLMAGAYLVLKRVAIAAIWRDPAQAFFAFGDSIGESHSFYRGLSMLAVGAALALTSGRLARWVFSMPPAGCPRCGYEKVESNRCPECGLAGFSPPPASMP